MSYECKICVKCVSSVVFSGENSSVQQHRCGKPLLGQGQRQVSPRDGRLPITDHLPTLEQRHRRHQVSGSSRKTRFPAPPETSIGGTSAPPPGEPWKKEYCCMLSVHAGKGRTRMKRLLVFQQGRFSRPFTGLCLLGGFSSSCDFVHDL